MLGRMRPGDQPKRIIIKHSTMIYAIGISAVSNDCLQLNGKLLLSRQSSNVVNCSSLGLFWKKAIFVAITVSGWHNRAQITFLTGALQLDKVSNSNMEVTDSELDDAVVIRHHPSCSLSLYFF